jgi:hypothetical protein
MTMTSEQSSTSRVRTESWESDKGRLRLVGADVVVAPMDGWTSEHFIDSDDSQVIPIPSPRARTRAAERASERVSTGTADTGSTSGTARSATRIA